MLHSVERENVGMFNADTGLNEVLCPSDKEDICCSVYHKRHLVAAIWRAHNMRHFQICKKRKMNTVLSSSTAGCCGRERRDISASVLFFLQGAGVCTVKALFCIAEP